MPVVAWTADLPEQLMLSTLSKNVSPITEATMKQFGDRQRYAPCTGEKTLECIFNTAQNADP